VSLQASEGEREAGLAIAAGSEQDRLAAVFGLCEIGVRLRGSVRTRGGISAPASARLLRQSLENLAAMLREDSPAVRRQVALALGEWGGEEDIEVLASLLDLDPSDQVRTSAVTAIGNVGGRRAVDALCAAAMTGSVQVRRRAVVALRELATGGSVDDTDISFPVQPASAPERFVVRRGQSSQPIGVPAALAYVSEDADLPADLRLTASDAARFFSH
jgi:HEAT repeat protein